MRCFLLCLSVLATKAHAQPTFRSIADPVTQRMNALCAGNQKCIANQRSGVQAFLIEIRHRKPSSAQIQRCSRTATKRGIIDWPKAARCLKKT